MGGGFNLMHSGMSSGGAAMPGGPPAGPGIVISAHAGLVELQNAASPVLQMQPRAGFQMQQPPPGNLPPCANVPTGVAGAVPGQHGSWGGQMPVAAGAGMQQFSNYMLSFQSGAQLAGLQHHQSLASPGLQGPQGTAAAPLQFPGTTSVISAGPPPSGAVVRPPSGPHQ